MAAGGPWLTVNETVERFRAAGYPDSPQTIRRLVDEGKLVSYRTEEGGHRRVSAASVDDFLRARRERAEAG